MILGGICVVCIPFSSNLSCGCVSPVFEEMLGRCEEFRDQLCASQAKKAGQKYILSISFRVDINWYDIFAILHIFSGYFLIESLITLIASNCCFEFTRLTCGFVGWFCSKWDWFCCARSVAKGCLGDVFPMRFLCKVCICMYDVSRMIESVQ